MSLKLVRKRRKYRTAFKQVCGNKIETNNLKTTASNIVEKASFRNRKSN